MKGNPFVLYFIRPGPCHTPQPSLGVIMWRRLAFGCLGLTFGTPTLPLEPPKTSCNLATPAFL